MSDVGKTLREILWGGFKGLAALTREALRLEFSSDPGKMNWRGMTLSLIAVGFLIASEALEGLVAAFRGSQQSETASFLQLGLFYFFWTILCMILLMVESAITAAHEAKAGEGRRES